MSQEIKKLAAIHKLFSKYSFSWTSYELKQLNSFISYSLPLMGMLDGCKKRSKRQKHIFSSKETNTLRSNIINVKYKFYHFKVSPVCEKCTELYNIEVARFKILSFPWFDAYVNLFLVFLFSTRHLLLTFSFNVNN